MWDKVFLAVLSPSANTKWQKEKRVEEGMQKLSLMGLNH